MANILAGREIPMTAAEFAEFRLQHKDATAWVLSLPSRRPGPASLYGALGLVFEAVPEAAKQFADDLFKEAPGTAGGAMAQWLETTLAKGKRRPTLTIADTALWLLWRQAEGLPVTRVQSEPTGRNYWLVRREEAQAPASPTKSGVAPKPEDELETVPQLRRRAL
jgi:hypothetical protein